MFFRIAFLLDFHCFLMDFGSHAASIFSRFAIILHTDKTVDIEHVVKVMDIAYRNKYKIVLATTPK